MRIKTIIAGAAIVLAATIGTVSAADQFSTLEGIAAEALTPQEMGVVVGAATSELTVLPPVSPMVADPAPPPDNDLGLGVGAPLAVGVRGVGSISTGAPGNITRGVATFTP